MDEQKLIQLNKNLTKIEFHKIIQTINNSEVRELLTEIAKDGFDTKKHLE